MALSRLAREFAAAIKYQDWSDSPWRLDRAGHRRELDSKARPTDDFLKPEEARRVRVNVMWVTAQVLGHADPNFDVHEYAKACGVTGHSVGTIEAGIMRDHTGAYLAVGE
ncbi:hypothetical protein [Microtetraspora malaysiensis]|uniref:hypothetical protein n=1 Tax=Microtetraspora malaysiensis TaxID=161358 RepID=UPI00082CB194|nr:hypothetical protein [Microtetraspora malaysiensis]